MKSTKHSLEFKKSLSRRHTSSKKNLPPHTYRPSQQHFSVISKSNTMRLLSAKDVKINNFMPNKPPSKTSRAARTAQKQKTAKPMSAPLNPSQQLLLKKSDKMKMVFWNQDPSLANLTPVVVSADFIVNQDNFWEKLDDSKATQSKPAKLQLQSERQFPPIVKEWKQLHKTHFVIWVIRNRVAWTKVQNNIQNYGLQVHALFLVKKKRNYTVDFSIIDRQLLKQKTIISDQLSQNRQNNLDGAVGAGRQECLQIFQTVKINARDVVGYEGYQGKIPVLVEKRAKVVLLRMEGDPPGLDCVIRSLKKWKKPQSALEGQIHSLATHRILRGNSARHKQPQLYPCFPIRNFITRYFTKKQQEEQESQQRKQEKKEEHWYYEQEEIDQKIEQMKGNLIKNLIISQGRQYQFEGGLSIYNFVGEMFKRNYKILFDSTVQSMYQQHRKKDITPVEHQPEMLQPEDLDLKIDYYELQLK